MSKEWREPFLISKYQYANAVHGDGYVTSRSLSFQQRYPDFIHEKALVNSKIQLWKAGIVDHSKNSKFQNPAFQLLLYFPLLQRFPSFPFLSLSNFDLLSSSFKLRKLSNFDLLSSSFKLRKPKNDFNIRLRPVFEEPPCPHSMDLFMELSWIQTQQHLIRVEKALCFI